ncbi:motility protein A [Fidelibacter multiformis]|uniref:motility protein A n=1 Tax=Fidelibacter multiformis TaxID=3377529 RepID=UPI0037DDBF9E
MDIATLFGLLIGLGLIAFGMMDESFSIPHTFLNWNAMAVVLGGTLAATMINYPFRQFLGLLKVTGKAFASHQQESLKTIHQLVNYSRLIREKGLLSLEDQLPEMKNRFMQTGIEMALIEKDSEKLERFLRSELTNMVIRHRNGQEMFYNMGSYAPAFGLLGTVMGLILMMTQQSRVTGVMTFAQDTQVMMTSLLSGMGRALVTTFYGVLLANLVFIPIGGKLKTRSDEEVFINEIILTGILSLHAREHPLIMEEKLLTFIPKAEKDALKHQNG